MTDDMDTTTNANERAARPAHSDDARMERFERDGLDTWTARAAILATIVTLVVASLLTGASVTRAAHRAEPGFTQDVLLVVGRPAGALERATPLGGWFDDLSEWATGRTSNDAGGPAGPGSASADEDPSTDSAGAFSLDSIDTAMVETTDDDDARPQLETLLVTGDSMAMPLDLELSRALADDGVKVVRDARPGSGISNVAVADWDSVAAEQVRQHAPDAVVVFIGANEGYPFMLDSGSVDCCSAEWTLEYARRAHSMLRTWTQDGAAHVYWVVLPTQRDERRHSVTLAVNHAVDVAAAPLRRIVHRFDAAAVLTPGDEYDASADLGDGSDVIVRDADGIHLNAAGSEWLASELVEQLESSYVLGAG